ncbi:type II toxin-antitoxin system HicA family toxin [Candidatus Parabeggiatoa sp. HSG14]|uniref:type II toxin-antitoxin system HicA family toxin n=1 Tax=Candidatus Parabeggiatoa sp. HSG14 TaxID=3055593 RepID=UPI0025A8CDF6|nr:type II toxin-antitoxin system HicA family toxin [Thiotrichales bacterium HSG14]
MPKKIRELIQSLEAVGFVNRGGKGSHRNFKHPKGVHILMSGKPGNDAKCYQERQVSIAIKKVKK